MRQPALFEMPDHPVIADSNAILLLAREGVDGPSLNVRRTVQP